MDPFSVFQAVAAVIIGVALPAVFYAGIRVGATHAEADQAWLRSELRQANDRLYAVSREPSALIPPRIEEPDPIPELPSELERLASDWENPTTQETYRAQFRALMATGVSPAEIVRRHLDA